MNAILGMADLLAETPLTPEQEEYVRIFQRARHTLLTVINDVLDLSKIEAGQIVLESTEFDLAELLEDTAEVLAIWAHEKGLELLTRIEPDVPTALVGDPHRLRQVFLNLAGNAVKFTERGEVVLQAEKDPTAEQPGALQFSVRDTGIGIPPEKLSVIFESFAQADASITRQYGGTGLGLPISKRLVELMGGRLWVESQLGQGSTFYFTAQFGIQAEPKRRRPVPVVDLRGLKVLVVDDNATNRLILRQLLAARGASVTEAESGPKGLVEFKRAREAAER